jgi:hypothetical protein
MTTTRLAGIVFALIAMAGCATKVPVAMPGAGAGAGSCSLVATRDACPDAFTKGEVNGCQTGICANPVNVVWDGKACQVMVGAQTIRMSKGNRDAQLRWWLPDSSNWEFREESSLFALPILFSDQNAPGLRAQFSNRNVVGNGKAVHLKNANTNSEKYQYQIRVFKKGGGPTDCIDSTDPVIYNDN